MNQAYRREKQKSASKFKQQSCFGEHSVLLGSGLEEETFLFHQSTMKLAHCQGLGFKESNLEKVYTKRI